MRETDREQTTIRLPAELKEKLQQEVKREKCGFQKSVLKL